MLRDLGRPEEALASYDGALAIRPDYAEALNNRGNRAMALGRLEEALASYDGHWHQARLCRGAQQRANALLQLGRLEEALASYDRRTWLKPDYVEALNNRGSALQRLGRLRRRWPASTARWS